MTQDRLSNLPIPIISIEHDLCDLSVTKFSEIKAKNMNFIQF